MSPLIIGLLPAAAVAALAVTYLLTQGLKDSVYEEELRAARGDATGLDSLLVSASGRVLNTPFINRVAETPLYGRLEAKMARSGGMWGGSVEVFLATAVTWGFIGVVGSLVCLALPVPVFLKAATVMVFLSASMLPYSRLNGRVKKREKAVGSDLPMLLDLVLMQLSLGRSVRAALDAAYLTMSRTYERYAVQVEATKEAALIPALAARPKARGPVLEAVEYLLTTLRAGGTSESETYRIAGRLLGTQEAVDVMDILRQADVETISATGPLQEAAANLREREFQKLDEANGKLPVKLTMVMGAHLLPLVFIAGLVPALAGGLL